MKGTVEVTHGTQCTNTRAENLYGCSLCLIYWEQNDRLDSKSHKMSELKAEISGWSKLLPHAWTHSRQHLDGQPMRRHVVSWGISEPLGKLWCCLVGSDSLIDPKGSRVKCLCMFEVFPSLMWSVLGPSLKKVTVAHIARNIFLKVMQYITEFVTLLLCFFLKWHETSSHNYHLTI